ncbi:hypothetical protein NQ318_006504 [Aromia moschata]|uniref:Receptor expression-enhancing protein n=1 Tax=Aromia moschata TaxID=1265417 RepID=A0AAV8YPR3_9CUCU|nr:hypothetical protein NQ318_006504 [Aromia moschata]
MVYVKWMMYWIVFALFTCIETFTDVFLSWFPFYYEIKIVLVIWLLSPATKGSSILYRKFVHPMLSSREQEIDEYITKAKEQSYKQVLDLGSKGVSALMQTAIKSVSSCSILPSSHEQPIKPPRTVSDDDYRPVATAEIHETFDVVTYEYYEDCEPEPETSKKPVTKAKAPAAKKKKTKERKTEKKGHKD